MWGPILLNKQIKIKEKLKTYRNEDDYNVNITNSDFEINQVED